MLDIGWTELLLIGIVALIVVGPKDLPGMFRTLGRFMGKARRMARDFQRAMEDAADEAGVKDVTSTLKAASDPMKSGLDAARKKWEPPKTTPGTETKKPPAKDGDNAPVAPDTTGDAGDAPVAEAPAAAAEDTAEDAPRDERA